MDCPQCKRKTMQCVDSRQLSSARRRRRYVCPKHKGGCGIKQTTKEIFVADIDKVIQGDFTHRVNFVRGLTSDQFTSMTKLIRSTIEATRG